MKLESRTRILQTVLNDTHLVVTRKAASSMDILEAREAQLHEQLFGARAAATAAAVGSTSITDRIQSLNARVDHLYGAVAGFSKLSEMHSNAQLELEMQPSSTLGSHASKSGDEMKRAVILSSDDRIDTVVKEFQKLKEMQGVLAQLEQLRNRHPVDHQQLEALENQTDLHTQRALALHARVERGATLQPAAVHALEAVAKMAEVTRARRRRVKTQVRQATGALFVAVLCVAGMAALYSRVTSPSRVSSRARLLADNSTASAEDEDESCADLQDWELNGGIVVYICALLYLFVALAIICDDYFVCALEKITESMSLSQDVAGATFMAAGSSAPELFVSLADNVFKKPEESLGIGTIVGSAIFNILIIIALSALLAGQVLVLDWRPLLRDSLWYSWAIIVLTYSVWDGHVDIYESAALFGSYACYIAYMSQNERVVAACCKRPDEVVFSGDDDKAKDGNSESLEATVATDTQEAEEEAAAVQAAAQIVRSNGKEGHSQQQRPWTIDVERVQGHSSSSSASNRKLSESSSSRKLARSRSSSAQDESGRGSDMRARFAEQSKNPIYQSKYRMFQYHPSLSRQHTQGSLEAGTAPDATMNKPTGPAAGGAATAHVEVILPNVEHMTVEHGDEPLGGYFDEVFDMPETLPGKLWFAFTRPIVIIARLTIPDCRYPQFSGTCGFTATFLTAIVWIAFLSHYTVVWATKFGCIAGIPSALMGLTIIAAGTSIPDALSSILVARDGHGDMAVSNALGSNVFDILLGLGLPFFLSNLVYKEPVAVAGDDLELSIFILFGILLTLVGLLIWSRWRLRPRVGAFLLSLYIVYVVVSYLRGLGKI
ncbi:Ca2 :cation antiporter, partial [Globisporangium splendens]